MFSLLACVFRVSTSPTFLLPFLFITSDVNKRYEAYGWHVQTVADVNDLQAVRAAIAAAKAETSKPSIIKVSFLLLWSSKSFLMHLIFFICVLDTQIRTVIGHGSSKAGSHGVHGAPLGASDLKAVKTKFGLDPELVRAGP